MCEARFKDWVAGASHPLPGGAEIHAWFARIDEFETTHGELARSLSDEERHRCDAIAHAGMRVQFLVSRGVLRQLLAGYGMGEPSSIAIAYSDAGKPLLADAKTSAGLKFNVSHCGGMAAFAFARGLEVGIDVENVRDLPEMDLIVRQQFAAEEQAVYESLPSSIRREAFFAAWTRKEAVLKAIGSGLASESGASLSSVVVTFTPGRRPMIVRGGSQVSAERFALWDVSPTDDFKAALAVRGIDQAVVKRMMCRPA